MKIPCTACGAIILPTTAAATGGVCMACKNGIRKDIEAAKIYYAEQKKPNPFRDYWVDVVRRVHKTPEGYRGLSPVEQTYFALRVFLGDVFNGGIEGYFSNSAADYYESAVAGLRELGASQTLELLLKAARLIFPNGNVIAENKARRDAMRGEFGESVTAELDGICKQLWADPDGLNGLLEEFALRHRFIERFTPPPLP
jgi:hypothetical protein